MATVVEQNFQGTIVDGLPYADDRKAYIVQTLEPVLEEMLADVLTAMPEPNPLDFMIQWLSKRTGRSAAKMRRSVVATNQALKKEISQATEDLQEIGKMAATEAAPEPEEAEEEDPDEDCDEIPESFRRSEQQLNKVRTSVSAEAYGEWNTKKAFEPPKYPKTPEQEERLAETLCKSFLFSGLEKKDFSIILLAMKECNFPSGEKVITEGDDGSFLFVIEKGQLECIKKIDGEDKVLRTCNEGDVFGELALLYNCPRAASVVAKGACVCWQLDRDTFNSIVKEASMKRREKYDQFLQSVTLFATLDAYERSQIADSLKTENYTRGTVVVQQNQPGDAFYIVEEGALYATKSSDTGQSARVMEYKPGDYFGELALLNNTPRAASVIVSSETAKVLSISRSVFNKMLGPLQHLLARQAGAYC